MKIHSNLKLIQRSKGLARLALASLLWILVRPISIAISIPLRCIAALLSSVLSRLEGVEYHMEDSIIYRVKYHIANKLTVYFLSPILKFMRHGVVYNIALFNQRISWIIGDYRYAGVEDDALLKNYQYQSNWFTMGRSDLCGEDHDAVVLPEEALPALPEIPPEIPPALPRSRSTPIPPPVPNGDEEEYVLLDAVLALCGPEIPRGFIIYNGSARVVNLNVVYEGKPIL